MLSEAVDRVNGPPPLTRQPMEAVIMAEELLPANVGIGKRCRTCGETKPLSNFYIDKRDGKPIGDCKPCRCAQTRKYALANPDKVTKWGRDSVKRNAARRRAQQWRWKNNNPEKVREIARKSNRKTTLKKYGLTEEALLATFDSQAWFCAICRKREIHLTGRKTHLDHCHSTMKFRGILCSQCNTGLGKFFDDPDILIRAAEYLKRAGE